MKCIEMNFTFFFSPKNTAAARTHKFQIRLMCLDQTALV